MLIPSSAGDGVDAYALLVVEDNPSLAALFELTFDPARYEVATLARLAAVARHEYLLISDSNIRVGPDYLRETAAELADPRAGLVTNPIAAAGERNLGAALENAHLNGFIAGAVCGAALLAGRVIVRALPRLPRRALPPRRRRRGAHRPGRRRRHPPPRRLTVPVGTGRHGTGPAPATMRRCPRWSDGSSTAATWAAAS